MNWLDRAIQLKALNLTVGVAFSCPLVRDELDLLLDTYYFAECYDQEVRLYLN